MTHFLVANEQIIVTERKKNHLLISEMNKSSRIAAAINSQANPFHLKACLFHCTPVSERKRRTHWDNASAFRSSPRKFNQYTRRLRKQSLLHNVSEFAENLFQSWQLDKDDYDRPSWFKQGFKDDGFRTGRSRNKRSQASRKDFEFCDEDDDVEFETIFRSAFGGGNRHFYWSFTNNDEPRFRNSSGRFGQHKTSNDWKHHYYYEDYDSSSESEPPVANMTSDRLALGLSASGPLKIEDVKNAYRLSALKWHPDRHQGSSKVVAEEKFKVCSAAYQSLCDKLAMR